jgi:DNA polymerase-3 subunit delta'
LLLQADAGAGALELALTLAQAWLCEAPSAAAARRPCGACPACRLVQAFTHPDLFVAVPEEIALTHGIPVDHDDKRKPSRQIRIDEVRRALDWVVTTSGRGRAKVLVLHPATALNAVSASALLKTVEEPPAGVRIVLTADDPARLLPTLLSRCQRLRVVPPGEPEALAWLQSRGVADARVLLAAAGRLPLEALRLHGAGIDAARWAALPQAVLQGQAAAFDGWGAPRVVDALLKLCHDTMVRAAGGATRYFPGAAVPARAGWGRLAAWHRQLQVLAAQAEHPWNEGLLLESLLWQAQHALAEAPVTEPAAFATLPP